MFSDDDSMPHLEGRTEGHTKDTWKTTESRFTENKNNSGSVSHFFSTFSEALQGKHSHEVQSVSDRSTNPADAINSFQSKKHSADTLNPRHVH